MIKTNEERLSRLKASEYSEVLGVKKESFELMFSVLREAYDLLHKRGGKPPTLSVLEKLIITLSYYRDYLPMRKIAWEYGVSKNAISKSVAWVESVLIKDKRFHLPNKRELRETNFDVILVDCTESPIQRPQKNSESTIPASKNGTR
jgi:predicted DNA-binding protein YlxM (UPF0122 family)